MSLLIPPQVKWTLIAVGVIAFLLMGWGIKYLYAKTVTQKAVIKEAEAAILGWDLAYTDLLNEQDRVNAIVKTTEEAKDKVQKTATKLAIALEKEKVRDPTKCAITPVPASYIRALINGLPSRNQESAGMSAGKSGQTIDQPDAVP